MKHWDAYASCKDHPEPELWFTGLQAAETEAKRYCNACPVKGECLELGMTIPFGIFGELNARERRALRRTRVG